MNTLILNSMKVKKTQLKFYLAFVIIVILLKTICIYTDILSIIGEVSISFILMAILLFQFTLFLIEDQGLTADDTKPYLLTLGISRKDLVNEKFLEVFLVFIINLSLIIYLMHDVSIGNVNASEGLFLMFLVMAYYLLLIPANIKFGVGSFVLSIVLLGPAFLPLLDKIGVDLMKYVIKFYEVTNPIISFGMILIFIILIYTVSLKLTEDKDF